MAIKIKPGLLINEFILFFIPQILGLFVGWKIFTTIPIIKMEVIPSITTFMIAFAIATVLIILAIKFIKISVPFNILFSFLVFVGAEIVFELFMPVLMAVACALILAGARYLWPNMLVQNVAILIAIAGVGAQLGLLLPVTAVIILLVILSVYDVIAVFRTKHMVKMFTGLMQKGVALSLVIPEKMSDLSKNMKRITEEKLKAHETGKKHKIMMLGTGDVAFPIVFAVSALDYGLPQSYGVIIGSLAGLFVIHLIMRNSNIRALPALPPIAIGAIAGFFISFLI